MLSWRHFTPMLSNQERRPPRPSKTSVLATFILVGILFGLLAIIITRG